MFPLSKLEFMAHLKSKHCEPNSTGSNSFSSDYFPEHESTTYQINDYCKATSPNVNISTYFDKLAQSTQNRAIKNVFIQMSDGGNNESSVFSDQGFAEDSNFLQNNGSTQLRYSDIVRKVVPQEGKC